MEGTGREKSISQSLFIKWCSATKRWNNQKPNCCRARGNDRDGGNSHLDRTVKIEAHSDMLTHLHWNKRWQPPLTLTYEKKKVWVQQSKRKVKGRAGLEDELRVRGMWQEKWELKRNSRWSDTELGSLQSQSAGSLAEAYQVFPSEWLRNCNKGWCTHINPVPPHERGRSRACFN